MDLKKSKMRARRIFRKRRKQIEEASATADANLERHFIKRLVSLGLVKRFTAGWIALILFLIIAVIMQTLHLESHYQQTVPSPGGTYREGILGTYKNINPIYASGSVDSSVSKLIFSGLLRYDGDNKLVGDLARSWEVDDSEKVYTFHLRDDVRWHDGESFTAEDVVFTIETLQNPDSESFLRPGWSEVEVEAADEHTVVFTLPSIYGAFEHSLTTGILPEHVLREVPEDQLRSNDFNNVQPVGTGPFELDAVESVGENVDERTLRLGLVSYEDYHFGEPEISRFSVRTFLDEESLLDSYREKEIDAMVGLNELPQDLREDRKTNEYSMSLAAEVMVFFKTNQDILKSQKVRQALVLGADRAEIINTVGYPLAVANSPLLASHFGYNKNIVQQTNNQKRANKILKSAGWKINQEDGIRYKGDKELKFKLYAQATNEHTKVAQQLQKQWKELGVNLEVVLQDREEMQTTTSLHNYDAILSAISIGSDPDVFAYWHSTQSDVRAQTRLNLSEYSSEDADQALEEGRSRTDKQIRAAKYKSFLEEWTKDNPALALYQPRSLYVVRAPLYSFGVKSAVSAADRFANVHEWMVRESMAPKIK